jgi:hypothetical protein
MDSLEMYDVYATNRARAIGEDNRKPFNPNSNTKKDDDENENNPENHNHNGENNPNPHPKTLNDTLILGKNKPEKPVVNHEHEKRIMELGARHQSKVDKVMYDKFSQPVKVGAGVGGSGGTVGTTGNIGNSGNSVNSTHTPENPYNHTPNSNIINPQSQIFVPDISPDISKTISEQIAESFEKNQPQLQDFKIPEEEYNRLFAELYNELYNRLYSKLYSYLGSEAEEEYAKLEPKVKSNRQKILALEERVDELEFQNALLKKELRKISNL